MLAKDGAMKYSEMVVDLHGITCICSGCKKVRNNAGLWSYVEDNVKDSGTVQLSHGICPECIPKIYPWFDNDDSTS